MARRPSCRRKAPERLTIIRQFPIKLEPRRHRTAQPTQRNQRLRRARLPRNLHRADPSDGDLNIVAILQRQGFNDFGWEPDCEAVTPFCDLHLSTFFDIQISIVYLSVHGRDEQSYEQKHNLTGEIAPVETIKFRLANHRA